MFANYAGESPQADNLDDDLRARQFRFVNKTKTLADFTPSFGGPLKQDRVWFYSS